jgi:hypothetical protein
VSAELPSALCGLSTLCTYILRCVCRFHSRQRRLGGVCFVNAAVLRTTAGVLGKYLFGSVVFSDLSHFEIGIHVMRKVFIDYSYSLTASRIVFVPQIL